VAEEIDIPHLKLILRIRLYRANRALACDYSAT
jgi:hypothetical protein